MAGAGRRGDRSAAAGAVRQPRLLQKLIPGIRNDDTSKVLGLFKGMDFPSTPARRPPVDWSVLAQKTRALMVRGRCQLAFYGHPLRVDADDGDALFGD